ncbi:MAG: hypothetical protein H6843_13975 [Rhodospirillaceae bacterium]|nr:hypothetical protein [Rhodospirillaceae bacterium]
MPDRRGYRMRLDFRLRWQGVAVRGTYDASPHFNRRDRLYLEAELPLFADNERYLVIWFGPVEIAADPAMFAEMAEGWLDEAAEERGLHPDDLIRYRQASLF